MPEAVPALPFCTHIVFTATPALHISNHDVEVFSESEDVSTRT